MKPGATSVFKALAVKSQHCVCVHSVPVRALTVLAIDLGREPFCF